MIKKIINFFKNRSFVTKIIILVVIILIVLIFSIVFKNVIINLFSLIASIFIGINKKFKSLDDLKKENKEKQDEYDKKIIESKKNQEKLYLEIKESEEKQKLIKEKLKDDNLLSTTEMLEYINGF